jgi:hypothetical protein
VEKSPERLCPGQKRRKASTPAAPLFGD